MTERYRVLVQGSANEPYEVTVLLIDGEVEAVCTCAAGEKGQSCKHVLNLLSGSSQNCIGGDTGIIPDLPSRLPGTSLERAMHDVEAAEKAVASAKRELTAAKKRVSACLRGKR